MTLRRPRSSAVGGTAGDLIIRRALASDLDTVRHMVAAVVEEVFGSLFPQGLPDDHTDWRAALVAVSDKTIVDVALTSENTIDDLWVAADHRRRGVGSALIAAAELEIRQRNYRSARLRVAAENMAARRFYAEHKWREAKILPHESWGFLMVNLTKDLTQ